MSEQDANDEQPLVDAIVRAALGFVEDMNRIDTRSVVAQMREIIAPAERLRDMRAKKALPVLRVARRVDTCIVASGTIETRVGNVEWTIIASPDHTPTCEVDTVKVETNGIERAREVVRTPRHDLSIPLTHMERVREKAEWLLHEALS